MGLFDFFKKSKEIEVPEPDADKINWYFSEDGKAEFRRTMHYKDEMWSIWFTENGWAEMCLYTQEEGSRFRRAQYPCTFFADYLRVLKTIDSMRLAVNAADLAMDGDKREAIPYPDCLKAEYNPLINFALKIKPLFHSKNGGEIRFSRAVNLLVAYLHDLYAEGLEDESNESWIYENSLWFNEKGKNRNDDEIIASIRERVKNKEVLRVNDHF